MTITRGVILDLLPVYLAGEASDESRQLVEAYLAEHPELRQLMQQNVADEESLSAHLQPGADIEKKTFERVRTTLRYRGLVLGIAIAYTIAPFSFVFHDGQMQWILFRDNPSAAAVFVVTALFFWAAYLVMYLRTRRVV